MNTRKSARTATAKASGAKARASRANRAWKRALSVTMAVLMAVSLSPWAEIPSAFAGGDAARAAQTAAKQGTVDVGLSLGSGSITVNGQTLKAPSSQITIPNTKDFTFTASAGSAATLTAVNLTHGQNSTPLSPDSNGVYTVAQEQLVEGVGIELETEAAASASAEESAPTAFTKKAPSAQADAAAAASPQAAPAETNASANYVVDAQPDIKTLLGNARYFGIIADSWKLSEAETNAAVKTIETPTQQSGNDLTAGAGASRQPWVIGGVTGGDTLHIKGAAADVYAPKSAFPQIVSDDKGATFYDTSQTEVNSYIDSLKADAASGVGSKVSKQSFSSELANGSNATGEITKNSNGDVTIDITSKPAGCYYVNVEGFYDQLKAVKKNSNQTIFFNFPTKTSVAMHKIDYSPWPSGNAGEDSLSSTIVWNMPQATTVDIKAQNFGVFYAPNADLSISDGYNSGRLIAKTVKNDGGKEFHFVWQEVTNDYPRPVDVTFKARKLVNTVVPGATYAGQFEFQLKDASGKVLQTKKCAADGNVSFDPITYDENIDWNNGTKSSDGTDSYYKIYTYTVSEVIPEDAVDNGDGTRTSGNIIYDATSKTITVTVTDYQSDAKKALSAVYDTSAATFANRTTDQKVGALKVTKSIAGALSADQLTDDQKAAITFEVKNGSGQTVRTFTLADMTDGSFTVGNLVPGTYTVTETRGDVPGYSSTTSYSVENGKTAVAADQTSEVTVTNTYKKDAEATFTAKKNLEGRGLTNGQFSFTAQEVDSQGNAVSDAQGASAVSVKGSNDAQGTVTFDAIYYSTEGEHDYLISEVNDGQSGVTYDTKSCKAHVSVTTDDSGQLQATVSYPDGSPSFKNTYKGRSSYIKFNATKTLEGANLADYEFKFAVYKQWGQGWATAATTPDGSAVIGVSKKDGSVDFPEFSFEDNDWTTKYKIVEENSKEEGITYDTNAFYAQITRGWDNDANDNVVTSLKYYKDEACTQEIAQPEFKNKKETKATARIKVTKALNNRAWNDADQFDFKLTAVDGAPMPAGAEGGSLTATAKKSSQTVDFGEITYTADGTYKYTVQEVEPSNKIQGLTYDTAAHNVTVTVLGGKATVLYDVAKTALRVTNAYSAKGQLTLAGTKTFENSDGVNKTFTYTVKEGDKTVATGKSNGAGDIKFTPINYTLDDLGDHTYTVVEDNGGVTIAGIAYDKTTYTVKVRVSDNGDGKLAVTQLDGSAARDGMNFKNSYHATGATTIAGHKQVTGKDGADLSGFEFTLTPVTAPNDAAPAVEGGTQLKTKTGSNGDFSFGQMTYKQSGTYYYRVAETGSKPGYTAKTGAKYVTVKVADTKHNGVFDVDVTGAGADLTFTNAYKAAGELKLSGTKAFTNGTLTEGAFAFQLKEGNRVLQTVKNTADGKFAFAPIAYATDATDASYQPGEHTYTVSEVPGSAAGVTYDNAVYTVKVNVTDDGNGKLSVTKEDGSADFTGLHFTNSFKKSGSVQLQANKTLNGKVPDSRYDGKFSFELKDASGNVLQAKQNGANGTVTFDKIDYTAAGTYAYTINEVVPADADKRPGVTYDTTVVRVTVAVDNENGALVATPTYTYGDSQQGNTFKNTYGAQGSIKLTGTKTLENQSLTDDEFSFVVTENGTQVATGTNKADGSIAFTPIDYAITANDTSALGEHTYKVSEVTGDKGGITYDANSKTVKVNVTDNGNGTLDAQVVSNGSDELSFTNTYTAKGSIKLTGTKSLTGRDAKAGEFGFTVKDEAGKVVATGSNGANGAITFTPISYTQADLGDHTYKVTEDQGNLGGVSYDQTEKTVVVHVADNGDGILSAAVVAEKSQAIAFSNTYTATGEAQFTAHKNLTGRDLAKGEFSFQLKDSNGNVLQTKTNDAKGNVTFDKISYGLADVGTHAYTISEVEGSEPDMTYDSSVKDVQVNVADNGDGTMSVTYGSDKEATFAAPVFGNTHNAKGQATVTAKKVLEGAQLQAEQFSFQLKDEAGNVLQTATNAADGTVSFTPLSYELSDLGGVDTKDFHYTVSEVSGTNKGMTYDGSVKDVTVHVALDKASGTLATSVTFAGNDATFTNTYKADGAAYLAAHKQLDGKALEAGAFSFELKDADGNVLQAKQNDANGTVSFDPISYTQDVLKNADGTYKDSATYTYTVSEQIPEGAAQNADGTYVKDGVTYDGHSEQVTVHVADRGNGTLAVTYGDAQVEQAPAITFANTYRADATTAQLSAQKQLQGRSWVDGETFTFEMKALTEGAPMPESTTATAAAPANGAATATATFGTMTFNKAGSYDYLITEQVPEGAVPDGTGLYELNGITYDASAHKATVEVTDNGQGKLQATVTYDGKAAEAPVFTNEYKATDTTAVLSGAKTLTGGTLEAGAYTFQIEATGDAAADTPLPKVTAVTNADDGSFAFDAITYNQPGTYTYAISEVVPADAVNADGVTYAQATDDQKAAGGFTEAGVTYDTAVRTATVTVTDNQKGALEATVAYGTDAGLAFTNTKFEAHAALAFDKYYYGSDLNRAFSFSLVATDSSWNPRSGGEGVAYSGTDAIVDDGQSFTAKVTNPAFDAETHKATVALPDLTYYKAGTYRYLLHENADSAASDVVDDASVYQITVTVGADQKVSTSIARVTGEATAQPVTTATFYNNSAVLAAFRAMGLAADVAPEKDGAATFMPEVQKDFDGSLADNTFTFEMVDENGNAVSHGVNDATGHVALDMPGAASADTARDAGSAVLTYTEEGTYTYTIREVAADNALISYDKGTVELTVTVTKDDNGVLTAEGAYTKHAADGTTVEGNNTFTNETRAIDLRVQKNSKSNGAPLEGARYGLWQYNPNGQDVYLGNNMSDKNGWITFRDVKVKPGTAYYFKEEAAPAGHLVNPYRDPYFSLVPDNANGYKLVYEGSAAFAQAVPAAANQREGA